MLDIFSASGFFVHSPCGPRKSGIPESVEMPAPLNTTTLWAAWTNARAREVRSRSIDFILMSNPQIRRLVEAATPLWAGEAEVVRTYWTSPKRSLETDLLWLRRQCFKEFWGSGVGKYDRGGVVPGQFKQLAQKVDEVVVSIDRHAIIEVIEGMVAEYRYNSVFAYGQRASHT